MGVSQRASQRARPRGGAARALRQRPPKAEPRGPACTPRLQSARLTPWCGDVRPRQRPPAVGSGGHLPGGCLALPSARDSRPCPWGALARPWAAPTRAGSPLRPSGAVRLGGDTGRGDPPLTRCLRSSARPVRRHSRRRMRRRGARVGLSGRAACWGARLTAPPALAQRGNVPVARCSGAFSFRLWRRDTNVGPGPSGRAGLFYCPC